MSRGTLPKKRNGKSWPLAGGPSCGFGRGARGGRTVFGAWPREKPRKGTRKMRRPTAGQARSEGSEAKTTFFLETLRSAPHWWVRWLRHEAQEGINMSNPPTHQPINMSNPTCLPTDRTNPRIEPTLRTPRYLLATPPPAAAGS